MIMLILTISSIMLISSLSSLIEAALLSVPVSRVRAWVEEKNSKASILLKIKENLHKTITSIVILNNISNILGSILVGQITANLFTDIWIGVISGLFIFLVIVFAEIIPKVIGERYANWIALNSAKTVFMLGNLLSPIHFILYYLTKAFYSNKKFFQITENEIKIMAKIGHREGILEKEEEAIIRRALLLNDIKVKDIMTPRIKMEVLNEDQTLIAARDKILNSPFSRIPLFIKNRDKITGLLYKIDALRMLLTEGKSNFSLSSLRRKVLFVPENKPIDKLMEDLRISQYHTAIVIDEYGGTSGLVTLEDILEEVVGDIYGEEDKEEKYQIISAYEIIILGSTLVEEVNKYFDLQLEDSHRTISKLILDRLNRFPLISEEFKYDRLIFTIEEVTEKTIEKVRIKLVDE